MRTVTVDLGPRSYDVCVAAGLIGRLGRTVASLGRPSRAVVVTDSNVRPLYGARAVDALTEGALSVETLEFPAGEANKTLDTYGDLLDDLLGLAPAIDRDCVIVALGGGVVGDVAGFVAATALRGLRVVQCATSLLAAVDSSVGGKTGIDHETGKNLIGAFHQPSAVVIDVETFATLEEAELANGLGECVKHGVIRDEGLLTFIEENASAIKAHRPDVMEDLVARNVTIKAAVVAADEREAGQRAHLNYGHTIGHAIEVFIGYDRIAHGRAVGLGMVAANHLAVARGLIGADEARRVERLLERLDLDVRLAGLDAGEIWRIMQHDKKARGGKVRMVLPTAIGSVDIYDDVTPDEVAAAVAALGQSEKGKRGADTTIAER